MLVNLYLGFEVFLVCPILLLLLPSRIPYRLLQMRGNLMFRLSGKTRSRVIRALKERLPGDRTDAEISEIARRYFWNQTAFFFDTYYICIRYNRRWASRFVTIVGREHLDRSLQKGKGIIAPGLHFPHPYHAPGYLLYSGHPCTGYAVHPWDLNVPLPAKINAWLGFQIAMLRLDLTMAWSNRGGSRVYRERLKKNDVFFFWPDVALPDRNNIVVVEFLGRPFVLPTKITKVIREMRSPVHVITSVRDDSDWRKVTVVVSPELEMTGDDDTDIRTIVNELEKRVVAKPDQWWGWGAIERSTPEFYERYRRRKESMAGGRDG
jgi:lauroyl/myristoyl acyltransferase